MKWSDCYFVLPLASVRNILFFSAASHDLGFSNFLDRFKQIGYLKKRFSVQSRDNRVKRASIAPTKLMHMILYQDDWQKISSSSSTDNELK